MKHLKGSLIVEKTNFEGGIGCLRSPRSPSCPYYDCSSIPLFTLCFITRSLEISQRFLEVFFCYMPLSETYFDVMQAIFVSTLRSNHKMLHCTLIVSILCFNRPKIMPGSHVAHHRSNLPMMNSLPLVNFCPFTRDDVTSTFVGLKISNFNFNFFFGKFENQQL